MSNNRLRAIAFVGIVLIAAAAATVAVTGSAAAGSVDTSAADGTTTVSGLQSHDTINNFNASPDKAFTVQVNVSRAATPNLRIRLNSTGEVFAKNTSMVNISKTGANTAHFNGSIKHSLLADVPMDASENVTMDAQVYNGTNTSDVLASFQFYINNSNDRAVIYVGDKETNPSGNPDTEATTESTTSLFGFGSTHTTADVTHDNLGVDGSNTKVTVIFANSTVQDAYSASIDRKYWGISSYKSKDYVPYQQLMVDGTPTLVFNEAAPSSIADNQDFTHGVYKTVDGQDAIVLTLGKKDYKSESSVDVETIGNDPYGHLQDARNRYASLLAAH